MHLEFLPLEPVEPCDEWVLPTVQLSSKTSGKGRETFPSPDNLEDIKSLDDHTTNTTSTYYDNSSNTTDLGNLESSNDQEKRMEGDIYPREFHNPKPSNILFEDMLEND